MSVQGINENINIGVPIYRPIPIITDTLSADCNVNRKNSYDALGELREKYRTAISTFTDKSNYKSSTHPVSKLSVVTSDLDSFTRITLDKKRVVHNTFEEVVEKQNMKDSERTSILHERFLDEFRTLRTDEEKSNFLDLYAKLVRAFVYKSNYLRENASTEQVRSYFANQSDYYSAINDNLDTLLNVNVDQELEDFLNTLDVEKTILYIAKTYLDYMKYFLEYGNKPLAVELSFYVSAFIKDTNNKYLRSYIRGEYVTYNSIKTDFNALKKHYSLPSIHMGRRLFEGKSFTEVMDIINSLTNLEAIGSDKSIVKADDGTSPVESVCSTGTRKSRTEITPIEQMLLDRYIEEKYYHYIKHNPIFQVEGIGDLNNYIAFLYENGIMPSDRFKYTRLGQTKSDRAFVFNVENFDEYMGSTKNSLRLSGEVKAMNHNDTFVERMDKVIEQETSKEMHEKAKQYVLEHKKENN